MGLLNSLISKMLNNALLIQKEKIADNTFYLRMRLNSDSFKNYIPGQQIRILTGSDSSTAVNVRTYSIWNLDEAKQEIELAVSTFSNGPGTLWIKQVKVGDTVFFAGPMGKFTIDPSAGNYIFLGDISALSHLYELSRQLTPNQRSIGIIYSNNIGDFFADIFSDTKFEFVHSIKNHAQNVISELKQQVFPKAETIAYIAGEASFCIELNHYLRKDLNWDTRYIKTKPFWHPEKKGLD